MGAALALVLSAGQRAVVRHVRVVSRCAERQLRAAARGGEQPGRKSRVQSGHAHAASAPRRQSRKSVATSPAATATSAAHWRSRPTATASRSPRMARRMARRMAPRVSTRAAAAPGRRSAPTSSGKRLASDQHSLGLVLYELITGTAPFAGRTSLMAAVERALARTTTTAPHTVVTETAAAARRTTLARLRRVLTGDLSTIGAKTLAHDPAARSASVQHVADDLALWARGEPILGRLNEALGPAVRRRFLRTSPGAAGDRLPRIQARQRRGTDTRPA